LQPPEITDTIKANSASQRMSVCWTLCLFVINLHFSFDAEQQLVVLVGDVCCDSEASLQQQMSRNMHWLNIRRRDYHLQRNATRMQ